MKYSLLFLIILILIICCRDGNKPGGPLAVFENPGPRALQTKTGLKPFYLKVLCTTENSNFC